MYKRQILNSVVVATGAVIGNVIFASMAGYAFAKIPVSYTHLDVYKRQGVAFDESSAKYKNGELTAIYFKDEIAGFAIHLLKN